MEDRKQGLNVLALCFMLFLAQSAAADTSCLAKDCKVTITLKIAFSGASDQEINGWVNDIESVWNGPDGVQTTGDCKCLVKFKVETTKITNASQVNCDPPPVTKNSCMHLRTLRPPFTLFS